MQITKKAAAPTAAPTHKIHPPKAYQELSPEARAQAGDIATARNAESSPHNEAVDFDVEAQHERALLSCLMRDPLVCVPKLANSLPLESFRRPAHRAICDAVVGVAADELLYDNGIVNLDAVADRLRERGKLADAGGKVYLAEVLECECSAASIDYYIDLVRNHWTMRQIHGEVAGLSGEAGATGPIAEIKAAIRARAEKLTQICTGYTRTETRTFADVEPKTIDWLFPEVLAAGMLTMMVSEEGVGKSTVTAWVAAKITRGGQWPTEGHVEPGRVIWFSTEESAEHILAPRFIANGAKRGSIIIGPDAFDTKRDTGWLDAQAEAFPDIRLVVFDPLTNFVSCNENANIEVRAALTPLVDFAERRGVCVLGLSHLNKKVDLGMINRTLGSRAWSAVPRMIWTITRPKDEGAGDNERLLINVKSNLGPRPDGLKFVIESSPEYSSVGLAKFSGERTRQSADEKPSTGGRLIDDAVEWLRGYLADGQSVSSDAVFEAAEAEGFKKNMLYKAKTKLGIKPRPGTFGSDWTWKLPETT